MKNLFKYKASYVEVSHSDRTIVVRVKGLVMVEADTKDEAQPKILKWLSEREEIFDEFITLHIDMIPSI